MDEKTALCTLATANRLVDSLAQLPQSEMKAFDAKTVLELLTCPVCKDVYIEPVLLPCGHMICAECWNGGDGNSSSGNRLCVALRQCYVCRQTLTQTTGVPCPTVDTLVATLFPSEAAIRLRDKVRDALRQQELAKMRQQELAKIREEQQAWEQAHRVDPPVGTFVPGRGRFIGRSLPLDTDGPEMVQMMPAQPVRGVVIPTRRRRPVGWATRALVWTLEHLEWHFGAINVSRRGVWEEFRGGYEDEHSLYRETMRVLFGVMRSVAMINWLVLGMLSPAMVGFVLWRIYFVTK